MRLAYNRSKYSSMGFVDRVADSRGISLLDALVVGLVSGNNGQEGSTDKSLKKIIFKFVNLIQIVFTPSCFCSRAQDRMMTVCMSGTII